MIGGVRVAIAVVTVCGACATARPPAAPNTNVGVSFHDFTESFNLSPETNADPKLGSSNEGIVVNAVTCLDHDGSPMGGYLNVANADVSFFDKAQVAAFVRAYPAGAAKTLRERNGKLKPVVDHDREAQLKANIEQCERVTGKKCVEQWGNGRIPWATPVG